MRSILGINLINLCFKNSISSMSTTTNTSAGDSPDTEWSSPAATNPDFASVLACQRFFFSSPGRSNSIIDSSIISSSDAHAVASADPYVDFRRSMEEMVEAGNLFDVTSNSNWECLHELLLCYLALNPKTTHSSILRAFSDLIVTLMDSQSRQEL